jgi:hypothetical protein
MPIARLASLCFVLLAIAAAGAPSAGAASAGPCLTKQFRGYQVKKAGSVRVLHPKGAGKPAAAIAAEARRIYPKFKALLRREPPSDKREKCFHGPDGKLDVYVTKAKKVGSIKVPKGVAAFVHPYVAKEPCLPRKPVFAIVRPGVRKAILAHEIYHAFQAAFPTKQGCHIYSEWNEALATWAGNYVYPDDNVEHDHKGAMVDAYQPLHYWGYATWVFPYYLTQKLGTDTIRQIEEAKATNNDVAHVDKAIPGGFRAQFPDFAVHAFNQAPVPGVPGIASTFRQWDGIADVPARVPSLEVPLGEQQVAMEPLTILGREYRRIRIDDPKVRKVEFRNATAGDPNLHVRALVRRADGSWTSESWDGRSTVEFCRDRPGEDVREIVLAYSNSSYEVKAPSTTSFRGADSCSLRFRVVSAQLEYQTNASADHILCGAQSGRIAWSGSAGADAEEQVVETERGRVAGYLGTDVTGGSSGHHLEGCRYQPGGYVPCVADMAPRAGTKSVGFSLYGGAEDASWKLRWGLESPEVGFVDAGDDECNVHIWGYFDAKAEVREVPRATFMGTAPFTLTFAGSGNALHTPNNTNATVNLEWSYSLTLQRVG